MKNEKKQYLGSSGVLTMFLGVGLCAAISAPVWNGAKSDNFEKTMHRAESLAYQILGAQEAIEVSKSGQGRVPASEAGLSRLGADSGEIGSDRWGHPFRFKVVRKNQGRSQVFVWSMGPNGKGETSDEKIDSKQDSAAFDFGGDDIGVIVTIK